LPQILTLSALGAMLALDYSMVGQFMVSQPLVVGGIFGCLLGDPATGLFVGALTQLIWLGVVPVGAYIPSDHNVTGGVAVILTTWFTHRLGIALGPGLIYALAIAIPAGALSSQLDVVVRRFINEPLAKRAEAATERGRLPRLGWYHALALAPGFLRFFVIYLIWLGPIAQLAESGLRGLPAWVLSGLNLTFWGLPALAFASVFELSTRDRIHGWAVAALVLVWLALALWPGQLWPLYLLALAVGCLCAAWRMKP
jgi:mannose/fructose/N-acetylgalactosamine-specific phosphotransferase system component IIC